MEPPLWTAYAHCPAHLRGEVEARARGLPLSYLVAPANGEVFDNIELCQERLQGFAFAEGFAIVRLSGSIKQARPRFNFYYIHYSHSTANKKKLEEYIKKNNKDCITLRRK
jgi:hypothetical protein